MPLVPNGLGVLAVGVPKGETESPDGEGVVLLDPPCPNGSGGGGMLISSPGGLRAILTCVGRIRCHATVRACSMSLQGVAVVPLYVLVG